MLSNLKDGPVLAFGLAGIGVIGAVVLAAMSKTVPTELWALTSALLGGGLGITNPGSSSSSSAAGAGSLPLDQAGGVTGP